MVEANFRQSAEQLLDFIEASPTPFHCVETLKKKFSAQGFQELQEENAWELERGGKYYVTRQDSSFCAFILGEKPLQETGIRIIGAHTDSPNLRLKPNASYVKSGYLQLGVEVYGGVLLNSWLDRDLSIAGRVVIREQNRLVPHLIRIEAPIARIPQLAIHLNREVNKKGLILNSQTHLPPLVGMSTESLTVEAILEKAGVVFSPLVSFDLQLYTTQKSSFGGLQEEFIFAPRLDNQAMCFASTQSLLETASLKTEQTRLMACFDHEEVGSVSAHGGNSTFLRDILERLVCHENRPQESYFRTIAHSFFLSADMAHAVHPNYEEIHESRHSPKLNQGPVVKTNANQRYASNGDTASIFMEICQQVEIPVQQFVTRTDIACGSTIGPMTTAKLGIRGVDVGNPMISMHSSREMAGANDPYWMEKVFSHFFQIPQLPWSS